ncbi:hypothetical protein AQUCO_00500565v1 [Aquilegia coerulea]|uniref:Uncharacterized protein n=1 Tax=Aquilegia coerulea TaxID=218851 RepID=A0A2G5ESI3_AQUCA|nr:hypothetical protein AQUCO_00500565v1 [Aquilegia coerulea]
MEILNTEISMIPHYPDSLPPNQSPPFHPIIQASAPNTEDEQNLDWVMQLLFKPNIANQLVERGILVPEILNYIPLQAPEDHFLPPITTAVVEPSVAQDGIFLGGLRLVIIRTLKLAGT